MQSIYEERRSEGSLVIAETETASGGFKYMSYSVNETYTISSTDLAGYARLVSQETNFRDKCGMTFVSIYVNMDCI